MRQSKPAPLPEWLRYLQRFASALAKLPPDERNESVDASQLEAALRKRVRGLDDAAAQAVIDEDRDLLETWLKDRPAHPAHWIYGFLLSADLATYLTQPEEPTPRGPTITFDAPPGWRVKTVPFALHLKAGKVLGQITAIDEMSFTILQCQREQALKCDPAIVNNFPSPVEGTSETSDVVFGSCSGKKDLHRITKPVPWKTVNYMLRVPGGFVTIFLGTTTGADFDESAFESKLHTIQLSETKESLPSERRA